MYVYKAMEKYLREVKAVSTQFEGTQTKLSADLRKDENANLVVVWTNKPFSEVISLPQSLIHQGS